MNKNLFNTIITNIKLYPDKWQQQEHTFTNYADGLAILTAYGSIDLSICTPVNINLSLVQKYKMHKAMQRWRETILASHLLEHSKV